MLAAMHNCKAPRVLSLYDFFVVLSTQTRDPKRDPTHLVDITFCVEVFIIIIEQWFPIEVIWHL